MAKTKIGIITTGQSPRHEYLSVHQNALKNLGVDVEVVEAACLDGLTHSEIMSMECKGTEIGIGCYVHKESDTNNRMGEGWLEVWPTRASFMPFVQKAIHKLEGQGVELILLCCAEEYPINAFQSKVPFIMPYKLMFAQARMMADTMDRPSIGVLIPDQKHYEQDLASWTSERWMRDIDLHMGIGIIDGNGVAQIRNAKLDVVYIWGYGEGIAPGDPKGLVSTLEKELDAPVVTPSALNITHARTLLRPALDEPSYLG